IFAVALAAASTGLVLLLGFAERRRTYAIAAALGARPRQLGAFVWSESVIVTVAGFLAGGLLGAALSEMLGKVLTGVFDPPPTHLATRSECLGLVTLTAVASALAATTLALRAVRAPSLTILREL